MKICTSPNEMNTGYPRAQEIYTILHGPMHTAGEDSCGCCRGPNVEQGKWYGVRSYLHLFYEDCTGASPDNDLSKSPSSLACRRWTSVLWKVTFSTGTLLLLIGAAALATGYLLPPKLEGIGEEEFMVLDQQAVEYNHALGICRAVGTVLCAIAGALLVSCILSSGLDRVNRGGRWGDNEEGKEEQLSPILQECPPGQWGTIVTATPVPFKASWVQNIQPKRES
ncbi:neurensin-2 [Tiliqua scincoides]|uniref:neurensin-2 n=1 Tax=Tiliqua scincoides TaxID=71010 RepID=UPI0034617C99